MMYAMTKRQQAGLSLVELMIAVALGLLLMLGVMQIFLSSKNTFASNQELSEIQESGRFALEILTRDIRNAGYKGQCISVPVNHLTGSEASLWSNNEGAVLGWIKDSVPSQLSFDKISSGGVLIQFAAGGSQEFTGVATNVSGDSKIGWDAGVVSSLETDDVALISSGLGCDLFKVADSSADFVEKDDTNSKSWSHDYIDNFELLKLATLAYYIADDHDVPTLHRTYFDYDLNKLETHALVQGVADMQLEYGVATGVDLNNGVVTEYVTADELGTNSWERVLAIRVTLSLEAASGLQKEFSTLIGLRNRLP